MITCLEDQLRRDEDVRQFDERVYQNDPASSTTPGVPTNGVILIAGNR
jgi:hypothetical protein